MSSHAWAASAMRGGSTSSTAWPASDIALAPGLEEIKFGSGLYFFPVLAIIVETGCGIVCWWIYRGGWSLLAAILVFNASDIPLILTAAAQPDPNGPTAPTNLLVVTVILAEILLTWFFARRDVPSSSVD